MSNIYPSWWNRTITIYNRYEDKVTNLITWYRTVIDNCFIKDAGNKFQIGNNTVETDNIICRIRKDSKFLPNYEWNATANDQKVNYFTLSIGDIIVFGNVDDEINEYTSEKRSSDLINKYKNLQGCMKIEQLTLNIDGGRGSEHYFVKGV